MQKLNAWLRPRHYYVYSGSTRRFNSRGLLILGLSAGLLCSVFSAQHLRQPKQPSHPQSAQAVIITAPKPEPAVAAPIQEPLKPVSSYTEVSSTVQSWVKAHANAQWGVVVQDLNEPANVASINENNQFDSASIYKLFLTIPLSQKLPFSEWSQQHTLNGQGDRTYSECVRAMLAVSDNPCGEAIGGYVGWSNATRVLRANGFNNTSLSYSPIKTTANDVTNYLVGLEQGKWFDAQTRTFILESLAAQKLRAGIPAGCSACKVLNKTGQLNGVTHDAAIVTNGDKHYALVIMSRGGSYAQIAELTKLINAKLP